MATKCSKQAFVSFLFNIVAVVAIIILLPTSSLVPWRIGPARREPSTLGASESLIRSQGVDHRSLLAERGAWNQGNLTIPLILHHVYIGDSLPEEQQAWVDSCKWHLSERAGWRHMFWDEEAAKKLLSEVDPEFLEAYSTYKMPVQKSDAIRYYIMKHYGGLYLDGDTQCWREGSDMLEGYDLVLQGHHAGEAIANGMLASIPGHPIWDVVIRLMKERRYTVANATDVYGILNGTGPLLFRDSVMEYFDVALGADEYLPALENTPKGQRVKLYPLGTWYIPCCFADSFCITFTLLQQAVGRAPLAKLAGMHHYSTGWSVEGRKLPYHEVFKLSLCSKCSNGTSSVPASATV